MAASCCAGAPVDGDKRSGDEGSRPLHGCETNKEQAVMRGQILRYYEAMMMQIKMGILGGPMFGYRL
jgi:hypothetical protein